MDLNVEIESAHGEKTEVAVDPLSSRAINKFNLEDDLHLESDLGYVRKTDEESVPISSDRATVESVQKCKHARRDKEPSRIF